jgi:hypothetical protein
MRSFCPDSICNDAKNRLFASKYDENIQQINLPRYKKQKVLIAQHLLACSMGGRWDWLLRRLKSASLNAFPLCSPQGHYRSLKVSMPLILLLCIAVYEQVPTAMHNKKSLAKARLSNFGWKMGLEPTTLGTL